jgi:hypothetical protein
MDYRNTEINYVGLAMRIEVHYDPALRVYALTVYDPVVKRIVRIAQVDKEKWDEMTSASAASYKVRALHEYFDARIAEENDRILTRARKDKGYGDW